MRRRIRTRVGLRGRLWLAVVGTIALVLAGLTTSFNLVLSSRLDHQASNLAVARASSELAALEVTGNRITLRETADAAALDSRLWIFEGARVLEQPAASPAEQSAAAALTAGPRRFEDIRRTDTRMYALPIPGGGRRAGTVVSAVSLRPNAQTARTALVASIILALLVLLAVAITTRWLISRALSPVSQMTAQADAWSEHDLDRRFSLGDPHDELTQLAAVLDRLLDRLSTSLRHEQRLTAELAHELRTPLAQIAAEAQYAIRHGHNIDQHRAGHEQVLGSAMRMSRTLETLIATARAELDPRRAISDAGACARVAIAACWPLAERQGVEIEPPDCVVPMPVAVEANLVERILAPLLENGCRYAEHSVRLSLERDNGFVRYALEDDGPGIEPSAIEAIFEPGYSGEGGDPAISGAGLGLPLARRLARAAGGDVSAASNSGGAKFVVRLPGA